VFEAGFRGGGGRPGPVVRVAGRGLGRDGTKGSKKTHGPRGQKSDRSELWRRGGEPLEGWIREGDGMKRRQGKVH